MSAKELQEKLFMKPKNACLRMTDDEIKKADEFCENYKAYLNEGKTEREACALAIEIAEKNGFVPFDKNASYKAGDKVYYNNRDKAVILCVFGKKSLAEGVKIAAAHIDSPRIDLKPNPLYEDSEMAFFKTLYPSHNSFKRSIHSMRFVLCCCCY